MNERGVTVLLRGILAGAATGSHMPLASGQIHKPWFRAFVFCLGLAVFSSAALAQEQGLLARGLDVSTQLGLIFGERQRSAPTRVSMLIAMPSRQRKLKSAMLPRGSWDGPLLLTLEGKRTWSSRWFQPRNWAWKRSPLS